MIALRAYLRVRSLTWRYHKPIPRYQKMSTCIQISCAVQWKISNIADLLKICFWWGKFSIITIFGGSSRAMRETFTYGHKFTATWILCIRGDTSQPESAIMQATLTSTCAQPYIWSWWQNARLCGKLKSGVLLVVEHLMRKSSQLPEWDTHPPSAHFASIWHHQHSQTFLALYPGCF